MQTTVDIPEPLHEALRQRAERSGASIDSLILQALEQSYGTPEVPKKGNFVTEAMIKGGERGPRYPTDENPWDLIFP
jgi:hypothetical protein